MRIQKFIFVAGGVCSGLGKGISAASIGLLLRKMGYSVFAMKLDPYLNYDPGTMNPAEHGEVFVTDDGAETDLDLGHYERFLDVPLSKESSVSSGQIYAEILNKERAGDFLGKTVQLIPHVTEAIKARIRKAAAHSGADIVLVEIGGTVGDIEGEVFFESVRQMERELGPKNSVTVFLGFIPHLGATKELKTKPMQNAVRALRQIGIEPDMIIARSDYPIDEAVRSKIALFANMDHESVIPAVTASSIYEVPLQFERYGVSKTLLTKLDLIWKKPDLAGWEKFVEQITTSENQITVGIVGKYMRLEDSYLSVLESIKIAAAHIHRHVRIKWIDAEQLEKENNDNSLLKDVDGILVPGGFGSRGIEGKITAATFAYEHKLPYLGLCLGSQIMSIALARKHIDPRANSTEFNPGTPCPVVHIMEDQKVVKQKGGTMRLGSYACELITDTKTAKLYQDQVIHERHRHRYEFNNEYREKLMSHGWIPAGTSMNGLLVEVVEVANHPFMIGSQYHPEFLSRPERPHPLFVGFLQACAEKNAQPAGK